MGVSLLVIGLLFGVELLAELIGVLGPHHSPLLNVLRYIGILPIGEEVRQKRKEKLNKNSSNQKKSHLGFLIYLKGKKYFVMKEYLL